MFKGNGSRAYLQGNVSTANLEVPLILIACLTLVLLSGLLALRPRVVHAASSAPQISYDCFSTHCYGVNDWFGNTQGVFTVINVVHLSGADFSVDNEAWLATSNEMCNTDAQGDPAPCDVEAGYIYSNGAERWFWVDIRPNGGYYNAHFSNPLASGDYGNVVDIQINPNGIAGQWSVQIIGHSTSYSGTSKSNPIAPNAIQIGQELVGFGGANAPTALFEDNEYLSTSTGWTYQTVDGKIDYYGNPHNPPWAGWYKGDDPVHYPYGGIFYTCTLPSSGSNPCNAG